jgi:flagellar biosynthesis chaperone FliJ
VLSRIRGAAVTEASQGLAQAIASELQAAMRLDEHRIHMADEQSEVVGTELLEAFAAWLPHARNHAEHLQTALLGEKARVRRLQQILVDRRIEAEAVAKALQGREAEVRLAQGKREQAAMDEAAGRIRWRRTSDSIG